MTEQTLPAWALVKDKVIVNVVGSETKPEDFGYDYIVPLPPGKWIGDRYYAPISATALRLTLISHGIMPSVIEAKINEIADPIQKEVAKVMWEYATEYHRDHPLIAQMASMLGLSEDQINTMWVEAEAKT